MAQNGGELQYKVEGVTKSLSLFDEKTGDLKSTYQIFDELKENWEKMSNAEKQELAINSAGKNQFEVFVAELDRFTAVRKAYGLAVNDNNMAEKENARYMESISAKISLFQNQLQELILGNGGLSFLVKGFLDATNAILKFANSGIGQFIIKATLLKTAITGATTAFNMLKASAKVTALIETIQQVGQLTKDYGLLTGILRAYIIAKQQDTVTSATNTGAIVAEAGAKTADATATGVLAEADGALNIMQEAQAETATQSTVAIGAETGAKVANTTATGLLTTAQEALNIAMKSNPIGLVITALAGLYGAYKGLTYLCEKYTDTVDSLNEEADKHTQKAEEHKNKLAQLESQYQENIDKIQKLSEEERNNASIDNSGKISGLKVQNELLQTQLETQQKLEDIERRRALNKKWKALNTTEDYKTFGSVSENSGDLNWDKGIASPIDQQEIHKKKLAEITKTYQNYIAQRRECVANEKKLSKEEQDARLESIDNILKGLKKGGDKEREYLLKNNEEIINAMQMFFDNDGKIYSGYEKKYKKLNEALNNSKGTLEEYGNYLGDASEKTKEASDATGKYSDGLEELDGELEDSSEKAKTLTEVLSSQVEKIEDVGSAYGTLKGAVSEYNKSGRLSLNTLKTLLSLNPRYLLALTNNNGKLSLNEKALRAQWKAEVDVYNQTLKTAEAYALFAVKAGKTADEAIQAGLGIAQLGNQTQTAGNQADGARAGLENFTAGTDDVSKGANQAINYLNSLGKGMAQFYQKWGGTTFQFYKSDDLMNNGMTDADRAYASQQHKHVVNRETKTSKEAKKVKNFFKTFKMSDGAKSWEDIKVGSSGTPSSSSGRSGGGHSGGGGSSTRNKAEEKKKKELEKKLREAKRALNKEIRASIKEIDDETNAYKKNYKWQQKQLKIAKKKEKQLKNQKTTYENVKKYIDEMYDSEINKLKDVEDEFQNLVQKERDALEHDVTIKDKSGKTETVKKNYVEIGRILEKAKSDLDVLTDGYDRAISRQERLQRNDQSIKNKEKEIKDLEAELKEKQKINDEEERKIQLQELQHALDRAKNMRVKVYRKGEGFVYGQDQDAINEAQKNLNDYLRQKEETDIQDKIDKAQGELDTLNKVYVDEIQKQEDLKQKAEDAYHDQYDALQGWYDDITAKYEDYLEYREEYKVHSEKLDKDITTSEILNSKKRIENLEKEKKKFDELWDAEEKKQHEKLVQQLTNLKSTELGEQESYDNRIKIFEKFVSDYENLASRLEKAEKKVTKQQNKTDSAKTAYDFQKDQDKSQKEALEKIKDKTDKAKTTKEVRKNKKAVEALTEYQKAIDKSQHELYSKVKKGSMTTNQAIEEYNMWARHWYNYYNLEKYGIPFTYSATGVYTQGKANMFGGKKATGDASIKKNGIYLVGDSPNTELVIGSKLNGIPMNLPQGAGVVNAKSTKTFAGWLNAMGAMEKDKVGTLNKNTTNNDNFSIGNVTVNGANINDGKSFANELLSLKAEMLQSAYRR